jgi:DNA-binding NtrC family response regulator
VKKRSVEFLEQRLQVLGYLTLHARQLDMVMDVTMPGLDGLKCMAEMKKVHPHLEVIILTGHATPRAGVAGIRKGAFDYCLKPIDFEELLEKIMLARKSLAA